MLKLELHSDDALPLFEVGKSWLITILLSRNGVQLDRDVAVLGKDIDKLSPNGVKHSSSSSACKLEPAPAPPQGGKHGQLLFLVLDWISIVLGIYRVPVAGMLPIDDG
jgi:hypothetical protein